MIPKTITPTQLRKNVYGVVHEVAEKGHRYLVVPNEGESVVICSREEYNALVAERELLRDLREAESDLVAGRTNSTAGVRRFLARKSKAKTVKRRHST